METQPQSMSQQVFQKCIFSYSNKHLLLLPVVRLPTCNFLSGTAAEKSFPNEVRMFLQNCISQEPFPYALFMGRLLAVKAAAVFYWVKILCMHVRRNMKVQRQIKLCSAAMEHSGKAWDFCSTDRVLIYILLPHAHFIVQVPFSKVLLSNHLLFFRMHAWQKILYTLYCCNCRYLYLVSGSREQSAQIITFCIGSENAA